MSSQEIQSVFMANIIHQLVALYVLMAEQIDSMICTSLGKKKLSVFVVLGFCCLLLC